MSEDRRNVLRTDVVDINVHLSWQAELPEWVMKSQPACSISVCTEDFARAAKSCGIIHIAKIHCKIVELWSLNLTVFLNAIPDYHRVFQCPPGSFLALFLELSCHCCAFSEHEFNACNFSQGASQHHGAACCIRVSNTVWPGNPSI